jgi:uncharacterized membrane protein
MSGGEAWDRGIARISFKRGVGLTLLLLTLVTIATHEAWVLRPKDPQWVHLAPVRWWLAPHILASAIALIVGALQFSSTLRRRSAKWHRGLGRTYALASIVASMLALYIVLSFEAPFNRWVMGTMAGLWLVTTLFAWMAARNRNFAQHRLWMGRSYCLAFTFVGTRFLPDMVFPGMDYFNMTGLYWLLIVASLLLPDLVLGGRALLPGGAQRREI